MELAPLDSDNIVGRGETYLLMGRYDEALADYTRAIELNPTPTPTWAIVGRGQTYQAMKRYDEALADYTRAIELNPTDDWAITCRGQTYRLMGRYDEALADFTRAIELNPTEAWAIAHRGQTYLLMGRYDEALADLLRAVEVNPDSGWSHYETAVVSRLLARVEEGEHWRRAVELFAVEASGAGPHGTWAQGNLFIVYCAIPEWEKAAEQLTRFLDNAPGAWRIREALADLEDLQQTLAVDAGMLEPLRRRLESTLAGEDM